MKNILKYILFILPILTIWSCDDDMEKTMASGSNPAIILETENNNVDLDVNYKKNPALTLTWANADYGVQAVNKYALLFSLNQEFENAKEVTTTNNRTITWTVEELNNLVLDLGMPVGEVGTLYIKVVSSLGAKGQLAMESKPVAFQMTPFSTYTFKDYYLVGSGTSAGWTPDNNNQAIFRNPSNENEYSFTGYFSKPNATNKDDGRFKLLEVLGQWQPQWGNEDDAISLSGKVAGNPGTQSNDPGRFGVSQAGYYTFSINFETLTYNIESYDASAATNYNTIGIVGSATSGWNNDIAMMRNESFDVHNWYLKNVTLGNGEIKFRANNDWAVSWGNTTPYSGTGLTNDGPNIPVTAGTYNIYFNDLTGQYQLIPTE